MRTGEDVCSLDDGITTVSEHAESLTRCVRRAVEDAASGTEGRIVAAVYLHGSAARGRTTPLSDVDLAVRGRVAVAAHAEAPEG